MCPLTPSDLHRIFEKVDMNGDGFLSIEELKMLLEKTGFSYGIEELESLVGKKSLDFSEFLFFYESMLRQKNDNGEEEGGGASTGDDIDEVGEVERDLVKAFKVFDLDGDGFITSQELECVLKRLGMWDDERCGKDSASMICSYDTNFDGKLDFQEFKDMMLLTRS